MGNALTDMLGLGNASLGSGAAEQARQTLLSRAYQLHRQEAAALGQTPLTPQQFAQTQGKAGG